jgi:PadR family transcriptional regulator PadR
MHGYGIAQHIQQLSEDVLQVEVGSLYPALVMRATPNVIQPA